MKKQRSSMTGNIGNVLAIIAGQFLVIALKGSAVELEEFRKGFLGHYAKHFGANGKFDVVADFVAAGQAFLGMMASRYGWNSEATTALATHVASLCRGWITGESDMCAIAKLRTIDIWSGLASCTAKNAVVPLSLLDYVVMTLLPVVCGGEIREASSSIAQLMSDDEAIAAVDNALGKCVKRLCCGVAMSQKLADELKLVALLHMPKDGGLLSANAGFAYKLLQRQYANARGE